MEKVFFSIRKSISTSELRAEHPFTGWNTQHPNAGDGLLSFKLSWGEIFQPAFRMWQTQELLKIFNNLQEGFHYNLEIGQLLNCSVQFKRFFIVHPHINKSYNGQTLVFIVAMLYEINKQNISINAGPTAERSNLSCIDG